MAIRLKDLAQLGPGTRRRVSLALLDEARRAVKPKPKPKPKKTGKYNAKKVTIDGHRFDSIGESKYYLILKERHRRGEIGPVQVHPRFRLEVNGIKIADYIADYQYWDRDGTYHCVDFKGVVTPVFKLKAKLMRAIHQIEVEIVR